MEIPFPRKFAEATDENNIYNVGELRSASGEHLATHLLGL